jgi:hypothetical protein
MSDITTFPPWIDIQKSGTQRDRLATASRAVDVTLNDVRAQGSTDTHPSLESLEASTEPDGEDREYVIDRASHERGIEALRSDRA